MKKNVLFVLCLMCISVFSLQAQKKAAKKAVVSTAPISLKTPHDTLSYAYGAGFAEQGLKEYLKQLGVIADTTEAVNKKNMDSFMKGVKESFAAKSGANDAYYKGIGIGTQLSQMTEGFGQVSGDINDKVNPAIFLAGLESALRGNALLVENPNQLVEQKFNESREKVQAQKDAELKSEYATEIKMNEDFLEANKKNPGVVVLPDGLQYKIITEGNGPIPTITDKVKVHYHGKLIDGTVFDSSVERGEPIDFGVTQVIKGWTEVLQLMPQGSKWEVYIPADLGYGSRDTGKIKPFSTLIFEIELLEVIPGDQ